MRDYGVGTTRRLQDVRSERDALREALLELYNASLAMVPHLPPIKADVSIRWDEAMQAADDLLKGSTSGDDEPMFPLPKMDYDLKGPADAS